jgi:hypothetical protein
MTPQQPINLGANTDKVCKCTLDDNFKEIINLCAMCAKVFISFCIRKSILKFLMYNNVFKIFLKSLKHI